MKLELIACFFSLMPLPACHVTDNGGSVVGNGTIHFYNATYDYAFDYASELTLTQPSQEVVTVDNSVIANRVRGRVSRLEFATRAVKDMKPADLFPYAEAQDPGSDWQPVTVTGVHGVFHKTATSGALKAEYLFLLGPAALLQVHMQAVSEADGLTLLSRVVDTLSFDTRSPVIHEVVFDPPQAKAGDTVKLRIHATDNMTQIQGTNAYGSVDLSIERKCRELSGDKKNYLDVCGELRPVGDDWYEIEVPTNPRLPAGTYDFPILEIWDTAGNIREVSGNREKGRYEPGFGSPEQDSIAFATLRIENDASDVQAPTITNVRFEPAELVAGQPGTLVFEATDDDPAFTVASFCTEISSWNPDYKRSDVPPGKPDEITRYPIAICGVPQHREDGTWRVAFTPPEHLPPGAYNGSVTVADAVGNQAVRVPATLTLKNDGAVDTEGPRLLDVKPSQTEFRPGDTGSILFKMTDNFSRVRRNFAPVFNSCDLGLKMLHVQPSDENQAWRVPLCSSQFRPLTGDWYAIDFKLGENIPTGEYWLPSFTMSDGVGNLSRVDFDGPSGGPYTYYELIQSRPTAIPVVKFRVVR